MAVLCNWMLYNSLYNSLPVKSIVQEEEGDYTLWLHAVDDPYS